MAERSRQTKGNAIPVGRLLQHARKTGDDIANAPTAIIRASFSTSPRGVDASLRNGVRIFLPIDVIGVSRITNAGDEDLSEIEVEPFREAVWFPRVDEGVSISGTLVKLFRETARLELNRAAAHRTSSKKAAASRRNGRKGGRPKKEGKATN